jgi:ABC-type tungstate transport system substrate-binding protein
VLPLALPNDVARLLIFAQAKENGRTQFSIARPLIHSLPASSPATLAGLTVYVAASRLAPFGWRLVAS